MKMFPNPPYQNFMAVLNFPDVERQVGDESNIFG